MNGHLSACGGARGVEFVYAGAWSLLFAGFGRASQCLVCVMFARGVGKGWASQCLFIVLMRVRCVSIAVMVRGRCGGVA